MYVDSHARFLCLLRLAQAVLHVCVGIRIAAVEGLSCVPLSSVAPSGGGVPELTPDAAAALPSSELASALRSDQVL